MPPRSRRALSKVLRASPFWGCGKCGAADNWGDRSGCRRCHAEPPASVLRRQREAINGKKHVGGGGSGGGGGCAASRGAGSRGSLGGSAGGGGGGGGGHGGKGQSVSNTSVASRSYADAVAGGSRSASVSPAVSAELAELRRSNERLVKQVSELRSAQTTAQPAARDEDEDGDDEGEHEKARDDKIRVIQANLKAAAALFGEDGPEYLGKKAELEQLLKSKREGKPLKVQLQNVDRRIERFKQRVTKADAQIGHLCTRIADLRDELELAEKELDDAKAQLEQAEEERKSLLLREAQAQPDPQHEPLGNGNKAAHGELEWAQLVGVIRERAAQPGVQAEVASQIGTVLDMLRNLCGQLPAPAGTAGGAAQGGGGGTPTEAGGQPAAAAGDGGPDPAASARLLGQQMARQIKHDMALSAAARAAPQPSQQQQPQQQQLQQQLAQQQRQQQQLQQQQLQQHQQQQQQLGGNARGGLVPAAPTPPAAPAAPSPPPPPAAAEEQLRAEAEAAAAATAAAAAASDVGAGQGHDAAGANSDALTSEDELDEDVQFEEAALEAAGTPEQRSNLKEILERRRIKTAQRRSGPKRLKRAGKQRECVAAEGHDPKKPAK